MSAFIEAWDNFDRFAAPDPEPEDDTPEVSPFERYDVEPADLAWALSQLSDYEQDILERRHSGCSQDEVARLFGVSQGGISYALKKAHARLQWHLRLPRIDGELVGWTAYRVGLNAEVAQCLQVFFETTCFTAVCSRLGLSDATNGRAKRYVTRGSTLLEPDMALWFSEVVRHELYWLKNRQPRDEAFREARRLDALARSRARNPHARPRGSHAPSRGRHP